MSLFYINLYYYINNNQFGRNWSLPLYGDILFTLALDKKYKKGVVRKLWEFVLLFHLSGPCFNLYFLGTIF